jgi:isochorismate synthase
MFSDHTLITTHTHTYKTGWEVAKQMGYAAALWRLPKQTTRHLIVDFESPIQNPTIDLEELPMGFVVHPFQNVANNNAIFVKSDFYVNSEQVISEKANAQTLDFKDAIEHHKPAAKKTVFFDKIPKINTYEKIVTQAIRSIENGDFQKVVLSRSQSYGLSEAPSFTDWFESLCEAYPSAFVSLVYVPQYNQCWLGASPETLVSMSSEGVFKTVSLAGTQSVYDADGQTISVKNATWTQKEIEEQAFVSRYIIDCLKKIRVREFIEEGPKTVVAGNLMHLRTDFSIDSRAINFPELATVMLELLHPTSAVCGMPKNAARHFIETHEGYNRAFYGGFLGPINVQQNTVDLFVNLRCVAITDQVATFFAGAGITEDSIPHKELKETELKMQTLLKVLDVNG